MKISELLDVAKEANIHVPWKTKRRKQDLIDFLQFESHSSSAF